MYLVFCKTRSKNLTGQQKYMNDHVLDLTVANRGLRLNLSTFNNSVVLNVKSH